MVKSAPSSSGFTALGEYFSSFTLPAVVAACQRPEANNPVADINTIVSAAAMAFPLCII